MCTWSERILTPCLAGSLALSHSPQFPYTHPSLHPSLFLAIHCPFSCYPFLHFFSISCFLAAFYFLLLPLFQSPPASYLFFFSLIFIIISSIFLSFSHVLFLSVSLFTLSLCSPQAIFSHGVCLLSSSISPNNDFLSFKQTVCFHHFKSHERYDIWHLVWQR